MRSTSAQIPVKLNQRFSAYIADVQAKPQGDDGRPTRLGYLSSALLGLPTNPEALEKLLDGARESLHLKAQSNPGVKRSFQMTDDAYQRLLELNAACVKANVAVTKSSLIGLALLEALPPE